MRSVICLLLAIAGTLCAGFSPASAQGCGPSNPGCIVPTAPAATSDNRAASTAFVTGALTNILSTPNTWTATQTFAPASGDAVVSTPAAASYAKALNSTQSTPTSGSIAGGNFAYAGQGQASLLLNSLLINPDTANVTGGSPSYTYGWNFGFITGTTNSGGTKIAVGVTMNHASASTPGTARDHIAMQGICVSNVSDGGTNTGAGSSGTCFPANFIVSLNSGATNYTAASAVEDDCAIQSGASAKTRECHSIVANGAASSLQAAGLDAGSSISSGTNDKFKIGFALTDLHSGGTNSPISVCALCTSFTGGPYSVTSLIDLTGLTASTWIFNSNNFKVNNSGSIGIGGQSPGAPIDINAGANAASVPAPASGVLLRIAAADSANATLGFDSFGTSNQINFRRTDGTAASKTGLVANDVIATFAWAGWNSAAAYSGTAAALQAIATETWSNTANGSQFKLRTTKNTTTATADAMVLDGNQHFQLGSTAPTSVSTCGTGSITANSTDAAGQVTATGATACTVNFAASYASAPTCVVSDNTTAAGLKVTTATGSFTVSGLTSGDVFSWACFGKVGL